MPSVSGAPAGHLHVHVLFNPHGPPVRGLRSVSVFREDKSERLQSPGLEAKKKEKSFSPIQYSIQTFLHLDDLETKRSSVELMVHTVSREEG